MIWNGGCFFEVSQPNGKETPMDNRRGKNALLAIAILVAIAMGVQALFLNALNP